MPVNITSTITTSDIARSAQVSVGTVSRVLTGQGNVDEELRSRVLKVVEQLGYVHVPRKRRTSESKEAQFGKTSNNLTLEGAEKELKTLMFCLPTRKTPPIRQPYFYQVLHGVELECANNGIDLLYSTIEDGPQSFDQLKAANQRGSADAIVTVNFGSQELIEQLTRLQIPVVLVDPQHPTGLDTIVVLSDYFQGTLMAMEHLINLGHRDIAFINGPEDRFPSIRRRQAYMVALLEAGLPYRPELTTSAVQLPEGGEAAMQTLLGSGVKFTAVFCSNDNIAIGAIRALKAANLDVPSDISVVGFDDLGGAEFAVPPLTTIQAGTVEKGREAVHRLLEKVSKGANRSRVRSLVEVFLVERNSTAPINP